jgi:hypothetical protein
LKSLLFSHVVREPGLDASGIFGSTMASNRIPNMGFIRDRTSAHLRFSRFSVSRLRTSLVSSCSLFHGQRNVLPLFLRTDHRPTYAAPSLIAFRLSALPFLIAARNGHYLMRVSFQIRRLRNIDPNPRRVSQRSRCRRSPLPLGVRPAISRPGYRPETRSRLSQLRASSR